jgi:hypothetical protein
VKIPPIALAAEPRKRQLPRPFIACRGRRCTCSCVRATISSIASNGPRSSRHHEPGSVNRGVPSEGSVELMTMAVDSMASRKVAGHGSAHTLAALSAMVHLRSEARYKLLLRLGLCDGAFPKSANERGKLDAWARPLGSDASFCETKPISS